jgi:hypothetical protein
MYFPPPPLPSNKFYDRPRDMMIPGREDYRDPPRRGGFSYRPPPAGPYVLLPFHLL